MVNLSKKQLMLLAAASLTAHAAPHNNEECDFLVIGSGAAGIIVATKLAEAGYNTTLLEFGGPMLYVDGNREIPAWSEEAYPGNNLTRHDTMMLYSSNYPGVSPEAAGYYCKNFENLAPCVLGGGTALNAAQQWCPTKQSLDNTFKNFTGWHGDVFQEAIQRVADRIPPSTTWSADGKYYYDQVYHLMGSVFESIGVTEVDPLTDVNDKYNNYARDVFASQGGQRGGPLIGYLQDAKKLPNFTLKMYSPVTSLVRTGGKITGVKVNGTIVAAKNVILSAGVNTVSLLLASAIGPESQLKYAAEIGFTTYAEKDWIINDGVGSNLHDHPQTNVLLQYSNSSEIPFYSLSGALAGDVNKADADLLYYNRTGPLADPGREIVAWIKVPDPEDPSKYMVVQFICARPTTVDGIHNCQSILTENARGRTNLVLGPGGNLTFANGVGPWLTNPKDAEMYAIGLKKFIDGANAYPGLNVTSPAGTHDLEWYINYLNANAKVSNNHWGGACSLGLCVDEDTLVHGTSNLYVVDGSLSPAPTTSNPAFYYEAMAELASQRIIAKLRK